LTPCVLNLKNCQKANNRPIGKNAPNQVTLAADTQDVEASFVFPDNEASADPCTRVFLRRALPRSKS
jgi:hypothetical protein